MKTDMEVHKDVLAELTWDPRVKETEIGLAAKEGVVTLTGSVSSYAEKTAAERAAERVIGVRSVANELTVSVPSSLARTDTEIAHAIVEALSWDVQVPDSKIKSAVTNGWVRLDGEVEWRFQRDAAARAIQNLAGVRGVSNNIVVTANRASPFDVTRSIQQALSRRANRTAEHITVEASGGTVTLKGYVPSYGDLRAAEGAAWSAPGVTEVRDELVVTW